MTQLLRRMAAGALHLFYPHTCTGCGSDLLPETNQLCLECIHQLPRTGYAHQPGNPLEKIFWGRLPVVAAHSEFYFAKDSLIQHLIHQLKYNNNQAIGEYLGVLTAETLQASGRFCNIDYLIPLPLFPHKERKRGYNQATVICRGMSQVLGVPVLLRQVLRQRFTETQTRKHRSERWENVAESFAIANNDLLREKHVLLVDDVVTTGATLEACGALIAAIPGAKLSIATLSLASK